MITKQFVLAGKARFTVETPERHYTFLVEHKPAEGRWLEAWFVKLLAGPENTRDYQYLGKVTEAGAVELTTKSKFADNSYVVRLLRRVLARVWDGAAELAEGYRVLHAGRCGRCGRTLTTPLSIDRGIGPECWEAMGLGATARVPMTESGFVSDGELSPEGLDEVRNADGELTHWIGTRNGRLVTVFND